MKLLMLRGLPASGKSTYARELVKKHPLWVRVNKDDLRAMIHDSQWSKQNEKFIVLMRDNLIMGGLLHGNNVVVDDTNLSPKHEERLRAIADECKAEFEIKDFDTPFYECIERDAKRPNPVGKKVIMRMWNESCKPQPYPHDPSLPDCFIFDVDGTLAKNHGHRSFYDYTKVADDSPNHGVVKVQRIIAQSGFAPKIFVFSGREDSCYVDTEKWLKKHSIVYDKLIMRTTGDSRNDAIVKREMFDAHVRGKYNPIAIFDDRNRVVDMWRSLGLTVCQVDYGEF